MRVAYFSAGDVGAGHLVRGLAIARGLARCGAATEYRIVYGALSFATPPGLGVAIDTVPIDRPRLGHPEQAMDTDLARALVAFAPDVLLVDLFWAPLRHVLPKLACEAWLLLRDCHRHWLRGPLHAGVDETRYARVIGIEPGVSVGVRETIEPIVVCNPDECLPPSALRERFGVPAGKSITLVAQAGARGELGALAGGLAAPREDEVVIRASVEEKEPMFPLAPWLPGADRIVGGGGYNLFWETRWLGLAGRTELRAFARSNEDQAKRIQAAPAHRMRENGADVLARMLR